MSKKIVKTSERFEMKKQLRLTKGQTNIELPVTSLLKIMEGKDKEGEQRLVGILKTKWITVGDWEHMTGYEKDIFND